MLFNSLEFMFFLPVIFTIFWIMPDRYRWFLLLVSSYFFYMFEIPQYGFLILGITIVSYVSALLIEKNVTNEKNRKIILFFSIFICLTTLFIFKYFNFFDRIFDQLLCSVKIKYDPFTLNIILPVGISFYTFQTMSYVIDVYRGDIRAEKHFGKYAAFVSFFPQLVAGPIERTQNLLPQIHKEKKFNYDQAITGMKQMLWGYYKKLVVSDMLSPYVKNVFEQPQEFQGFSLVIASIFFSIQIYCDFSGYSDIAIGVSKLFGINLMKNFDSPYFSKSLREFWNRWHISLSTWFRDYVYIPMGGNRVGKLRHCFNLLITFMISGLWHGADWTFIIWGSIHGLGQILETLLFGKAKESRYLPIRVLQTIIVDIFCILAWVFFVSNTVSDAFYVIAHSFSGLSAPISYIRNGLSDIQLKGFAPCLLIGITSLIVFIYDYIAIKKKSSDWFLKSSRIVQWIYYIFLGLMILFFSQKGVTTEFIYFQF